VTPTSCPNCRAADCCHPFYEARAVPTNSCLLVEDREAALRFPTADIVLAACRQCGFIFNAAFDPARTIYSDRYEETQGFSATFNAFNHSLAEELIEAYDIRGKTVLEIGCGKGEFLSLICALGGNRGIGYDPSFVPARQRLDQNVRFMREFFTEETNEIAPDLLCCKMTLEHISQTGRFLEIVRAAAKREDTVVFFQVPEVGRILQEGAFWDVYYEHCSYFSAVSLDRLFAGAGFAVERIWTGYDDQYLMIVARPAAGGADHVADAGDVAAILRACDCFAETVARRRAAWRRRLRDWAAAGCRTVLWGSGSKAVAFLTSLGVRDEVAYAVDINPYRVDKFLPGTGQRIVAPDFLRDYRPDRVVILNPVYRDEIARELARQHCAPQIYTILEAESRQHDG
jgi:SAM-dependent methyltransferase